MIGRRWLKLEHSSTGLRNHLAGDHRRSRAGGFELQVAGAGHRFDGLEWPAVGLVQEETCEVLEAMKKGDHIGRRTEVRTLMKRGSGAS